MTKKEETKMSKSERIHERLNRILKRAEAMIDLAKIYPEEPLNYEVKFKKTSQVYPCATKEELKV